MGVSGFLYGHWQFCCTHLLVLVSGLPTVCAGAACVWNDGLRLLQPRALSTCDLLPLRRPRHLPGNAVSPHERVKRLLIYMLSVAYLTISYSTTYIFSRFRMNKVRKFFYCQAFLTKDENHQHIGQDLFCHAHNSPMVLF